MNINFENKTAIITGATQGIGYSIASLLSKENCRVIYTGRSAEPQSSIAGAEYVRLDLSDELSIENFLYTVRGNVTTLDILINNAGIQIPGTVEEFNLNDWNQVMAVNLTGPIQLIHGLLPLMKKKQRSHILNISSIAGIISKSGQASYSATKSGLIGLTKSMALDLAENNILINALCPGTTNTSMVQQVLSENKKEKIIRGIPLGRLADPIEIANCAAFLVSDLNTYITGQSIIIDGGYTIQ
jgi:3-oxoacyl-[acyl-carrier protein] reductase